MQQEEEKVKKAQLGLLGAQETHQQQEAQQEAEHQAQEAQEEVEEEMILQIQCISKMLAFMPAKSSKTKFGNTGLNPDQHSKKHPQEWLAEHQPRFFGGAATFAAGLQAASDWADWAVHNTAEHQWGW